MAALAKLAIPVVLGIIALVAGGGTAKADPKKAYEAGFAHGKADAMAGKSKDSSPASVISGATAEEIAEYNKGYSAGYDANKKTGGTTTPPKTNKYDAEGIEQAGNRGWLQGEADGLKDATEGSGYGYTHTKAPYTRSDLRAAYESRWPSGYSKGYADGKKYKESGGEGTIIGDVLGTRGHDPRSFRPHTSVSTGGWGRESLRRPGGYPRDWYNY
jgi:hypothetical protein